MGAVAGTGGGRAGQWDREPVGGPVLAAAALSAEPASVQRVKRARREARRRSHLRLHLRFRRPVRAGAAARRTIIGALLKWGAGQRAAIRNRNLSYGDCGLRSELGRERLRLREQVSRSAALEY